MLRPSSGPRSRGVCGAFTVIESLVMLFLLVLLTGLVLSLIRYHSRSEDPADDSAPPAPTAPESASAPATS